MRSLLLIFCCLLKPALADSPVWLIESGDNQLYLAGTIHVLRADDYPLPEAFNRAYSRSSSLAFETDLNNSRNASFSQQLVKMMSLSEGKRLEQLLSEQTLLRLKKYLRDNRLNYEQL